jgi:hypothetical protein
VVHVLLGSGVWWRPSLIEERGIAVTILAVDGG